MTLFGQEDSYLLLEYYLSALKLSILHLWNHVDLLRLSADRVDVFPRGGSEDGIIGTFSSLVGCVIGIGNVDCVISHFGHRRCVYFSTKIAGTGKATDCINGECHQKGRAH